MHAKTAFQEPGFMQIASPPEIYLTFNGQGQQRKLPNFAKIIGVLNDGAIFSLISQG